MAEYTNFGFMRPGGDGPVKRFFKRIFRPQRGLVGDVPVTELKRTTPPVKEKQLPVFERERDVMKRWLEHPSYKGRLEKELYGEGPVVVPEQKNIEDWQKTPENVREEMARDRINEEYAKRLSQVSTVKPMFGDVGANTEGYYNPDSHTITMRQHSPTSRVKFEPGTFYHEFTHALDNQRGPFGVPERSPFTEVKERIVTYPSQVQQEYHEKYGKNYKPAVKELSESLVEDFKKGRIQKPDYLTAERFENMLRGWDPFGTFLYKPDKTYGITQEYIDEVMKRPAAQKAKAIKDAEQKIYHIPGVNYLNLDPEIKARINGLRIQAFDKYKYDPNKPFRIQDYPELKKDRQYRHLKDGLKMSDDDINEMSKYVAKAEPQRQYIQTIPQRQAQYQALQNMA